MTESYPERSTQGRTFSMKTRFWPRLYGASCGERTIMLTSSSSARVRPRTPSTASRNGGRQLVRFLNGDVLHTVSILACFGEGLNQSAAVSGTLQPRGVALLGPRHAVRLALEGSKRSLLYLATDYGQRTTDSLLAMTPIAQSRNHPITQSPDYSITHMPYDPELTAETRAWFVKAGKDLAAAYELQANPRLRRGYRVSRSAGCRKSVQGVSHLAQAPVPEDAQPGRNR